MKHLLPGIYTEYGGVTRERDGLREGLENQFRNGPPVTDFGVRNRSLRKLPLYTNELSHLGNDVLSYQRPAGLLREATRNKTDPTHAPSFYPIHPICKSMNSSKRSAFSSIRCRSLFVSPFSRRYSWAIFKAAKIAI